MKLNCFFTILLRHLRRRAMYTIRNTERNNDTASEYETKSLLYLLGMREDSDEVSILFIDCLNDVTGCSKDFKKLWDVQSKGVSSLRPLTIGESLITLFSNYSSDDIDFSHFILIIPKLKLGYLNDENLKQFGVDNFFNYERIREGLTRKILNENDDFLVLPEYINTQLDAFLDKVLFVVADHHKSQYVKNIIDFVDKESKSKEFYTNIFDEIRNKQTALKNINIEDKEINSPSSLLKFNKHLKRRYRDFDCQ